MKPIGKKSGEKPAAHFTQRPRRGASLSEYYKIHCKPEFLKLAEEVQKQRLLKLGNAAKRIQRAIRETRYGFNELHNRYPTTVEVKTIGRKLKIINDSTEKLMYSLGLIFKSVDINTHFTSQTKPYPLGLAHSIFYPQKQEPLMTQLHREVNELGQQGKLPRDFKAPWE